MTRLYPTGTGLGVPFACGIHLVEGNLWQALCKGPDGKCEWKSEAREDRSSVQQARSQHLARTHGIVVRERNG